MSVCIIGMGKIGRAVYEAMYHFVDDLTGVDKGDTIPVSDVYIVCVPDNQVLNVVKSIDCSRYPLVSIESTVALSDYLALHRSLERMECDYVFFPHRWFEGDDEHQVFNLHRVMSDNERGLKFYTKFMPREFIHIATDFEAVFSKVLENSYRYMEIAIAEELRMLCEKYGIDFDTIRTLCNTKWNIDIREARDGIGKHCLPKDIAHLHSFFNQESKVIDVLIDADERYIKWFRELRLE